MPGATTPPPRPSFPPAKPPTTGRPIRANRRRPEHPAGSAAWPDPRAAGAWLGLHYGWRSTFWAVTVIGVIAVLVTAWWVPADSGAARGSLRREVRAVTRLPVLLGLLMTTLGFGSMFTVYTYIQPLLTGITGFGETAVAPILLLFGVGMIVGNLLGGRLADRGLARALLLTLAGLAAT